MRLVAKLASNRLACGVALCLVVGASCSSGGDRGWVEQARAAPVDLSDPELDEDLDGAASDPLGCVLADGTGPPALVQDAIPSSPLPSPEPDRGVGNDPFRATGARPLPGPDLGPAPRPEEPVTVVVARPHDPDEHVAARNPEGVVTGPVPLPRLPGGPEPAPGAPTSRADTTDGVGADALAAAGCAGSGL